mmetsp:Transcript_25447/g.38670  ORF Transcript_25447/g.38670 Transcript_25447/m.38670 type:complete len:289 (-) Transcript_25447:102-968(-)
MGGSGGLLLHLLHLHCPLLSGPCLLARHLLLLIVIRVLHLLLLFPQLLLQLLGGQPCHLVEDPQSLQPGLRLGLAVLGGLGLDFGLGPFFGLRPQLFFVDLVGSIAEAAAGPRRQQLVEHVELLGRDVQVFSCRGSLALHHLVVEGVHFQRASRDFRAQNCPQQQGRQHVPKEIFGNRRQRMMEREGQDGSLQAPRQERKIPRNAVEEKLREDVSSCALRGLCIFIQRRWMGACAYDFQGHVREPARQDSPKFHEGRALPRGPSGEYSFGSCFVKQASAISCLQPILS